jgi:hypothetical protein
LQRIADALDRSSRAASRDRSSATGSYLPQAPASEPPLLPEFSVEFVAGHDYRLRNVSTVRATGVTVTIEDSPEGMARDLPLKAEMPPLSSVGPFSIVGSWQNRVPQEVLVTCDQLPDPVQVPLPPRR